MIKRESIAFRIDHETFFIDIRRTLVHIFRYCLYVLVVGKRLRLPVAALHPLLKFFFAYMRNRTKSLPAFLVVGEICLARTLDVGETVHHLVLVKAAVLVHLVNDKHITLRGVFGEEHVDVVAVNALRATDIAVGVLHFLLPLLAVCISATTHGALRVLDGNVISINPHMSFLVVTCRLLCISRVDFRSCLCFGNGGCHSASSVSCWFLCFLGRDIVLLRSTRAFPLALRFCCCQ